MGGVAKAEDITEPLNTERHSDRVRSVDGWPDLICVRIPRGIQQEKIQEKSMGSQCLTHHVRVDTGSRHVDAASAGGKRQLQGRLARSFR